MLVVAGHDSSGRAGVDADREACLAHGLRADCVVTAWTIQDATGVRELRPRAPREWSDEALELARRGPAALKFGLLPGAAHVEAARLLVRELRARFGPDRPVVLDPVLAASTGERFLDEEGVAALLAALPELGAVWTPNLAEALVLAGLPRGTPLVSVAERARVAALIGARGARAVVLKGGHGGEDPVVDLVWQPGGIARIEHPRVVGAGMRGSGCRHASALAAGLARGLDVEQAARQAGAWLAALIARSSPDSGPAGR